MPGYSDAEIDADPLLSQLREITRSPTREGVERMPALLRQITARAFARSDQVAASIAEFKKKEEAFKEKEEERGREIDAKIAALWKTFDSTD